MCIVGDAYHNSGVELISKNGFSEHQYGLEFLTRCVHHRTKAAMRWTVGLTLMLELLIRYVDVLKRGHSETKSVHSSSRTYHTLLHSAGRAGMRHYAARNLSKGTQYEITEARIREVPHIDIKLCLRMVEPLS